RVQQAVQKAKANVQTVEEAPPTDTAARIESLISLLEQQGTPAKPGPKTSKVLLRSGGRMILVDQKEICYASIEEGLITVIWRDGEGESNCRTLEELADSLDSNLFWRAHRSYLVNINRIREVVPWFKSSYQLRMDDKNHSEVPVSRAQTKRLRELFRL